MEVDFAVRAMENRGRSKVRKQPGKKAGVRARIAVAGAAIAILLAGAAAAQADAAARRGLIVVKKSISLRFPGPGLYMGRVTVGAKTVKKPARNKRGNKPHDDVVKAAKKNAHSFCNFHLGSVPVRVVHLSTPPFLIGADRPFGKQNTYRVTGPRPPRGDRVRANQPAKTRRFKRSGFKWEVWCRRVQVIKPYPY